MIGERLRRARKSSGLSLRDLGKQIGLSHAAIKKYEDNIVMPNSETLIKLCEALKVRAAYFFTTAKFNSKDIKIISCCYKRAE